jgi:D-serine dehydratase
MMKHADLTTLTATFPLVQDLIALKETTWFNPATTTLAEGLPYVGLTADDVQTPMPAFSASRPIWRKPSGNGRQRRDYRIGSGCHSGNETQP